MIFRRLGVATLGLLLAAATAQATEYDFRLVRPIQSSFGIYESEDGVSFHFIVLTSSIYCSITNGSTDVIANIITGRSTEVITIDWNRCSITLPGGQTSNVMRDGQKYIDKDAVVPPTSVPPGGRITTALTPTSNVYYANGWRVLDMNVNDGSQIGLYLALEVAGRSADQYFVFEAVEKPTAEKPVEEESSPPAASVPPLLRTIIKVALVLSIILLVTAALPDS